MFEIFKTIIVRGSEFVEDNKMTISFLKVLENNGNNSKMVVQILNQLEAPRYTFNREDVTISVRDHFSMHESSSIAIWVPPMRSELKDQLWKLDQNVSGFKQCLTILIDEFGSLKEIFDWKTGRFEAPENLHCPTALVRASR